MRPTVAAPEELLGLRCGSLSIDKCKRRRNNLQLMIEGRIAYVCRYEERYCPRNEGLGTSVIQRHPTLFIRPFIRPHLTNTITITFALRDTMRLRDLRLRFVSKIAELYRIDSNIPK